MSDKKFSLEIVTPKATVFSGDVTSFTVPGELGGFQVLVNHAPILSSLTKGIIKIVDVKGTETRYSTNGGFAEVHNNKASIVVENVEKV
ncbi:MAG: ATP synthase F1 subunit epsilon [Ignavibacteriales bacterium]|nr:ATP synthase F1 subunit epsilon [Ignavibacteriales bacterium]